MTIEAEDLGRLLDRAAVARDEGDDELAESLARRALERLEAAVRDPDLVAEALLLIAEIAIDERRDEEAFARLDEASRIEGAEAEAALLRGRLHLLRWELDEAERQLAQAEADPDVRASALYERAILADVRGDEGEADALYREASQLDPETFREPVRMSDADAREILDEIVDTLPESVQRALANVAIEIVPMPDPEIDAGPDTEPLLLGLYTGLPESERSVSDTGVLPGRIRVFKRNLERIAGFEARMAEELRITLLHEIGHHLGWDEEDLAARGLD